MEGNTRRKEDLEDYFCALFGLSPDQTNEGVDILSKARLRIEFCVVGVAGSWKQIGIPVVLGYYIGEDNSRRL